MNARRTKSVVLLAGETGYLGKYIAEELERDKSRQNYWQEMCKNFLNLKMHILQ